MGDPFNILMNRQSYRNVSIHSICLIIPIQIGTAGIKLKSKRSTRNSVQQPTWSRSTTGLGSGCLPF